MRVVRDDDSGTSNILKTYLESVDPDRLSEACDPNAAWSSFAAPAASENNTWPIDGSPLYPGASLPDSSATPDCSAITSSDGPQPAGGDALLLTLSLTPGGIGYADLATLEQFEGQLQPWTTSVLVRASVQSAIVPSMYTNAASIKSANCDFASLSLPEGGAGTGMAGLTFRRRRTPRCRLTPGPGQLDQPRERHRPGTRYPICGLSFYLVYFGLSTPPPGTSGGGPSAIVDLSNDQRRTLYSYMLFILRSMPRNCCPAPRRAPAECVAERDRIRVRSELLV